MIEEIINNIREKEKQIKHIVDGSKYNVTGVGILARVTAVLATVNFDNGFLNIWKERQAKAKFAELVPLNSTITGLVAQQSFDKAYHAGDMVAKSSANFGTKVHSWLEHFALYKEFPRLEEDPYSDVTKIFNSVVKFVNDFGLGTDKVQIVKPELFLYHTLGYAGTADLVVMRGGKPYLIDYKATNSLKFQYLLQLSAYAAALKELYGLDIEKATLIRFDKKGEGYERLALTKEELQYYFQFFKMCLALYKLVQNPMHQSVKELYTMDYVKSVTAGLL
jgi:hypothetical protein